MANIKAHVLAGEEAIWHSKGNDDLVIITLERYNEMFRKLKKYRR
jgi:hypothetical protein